MSSLKKKSATALAWDFGGLLVQRGSGFVISIFLARLLSPEEFGLVGMAMVFIAIFQVFIDVGFSSALIQSKENSATAYNSVFYFNIFAGLVLTLSFYFIAPLIGAFYENDEIVSLVRWLSLIFLFNSFNQVQSAILNRELNFRVLTIRNVIAALIGGIAGIVAAFQGLGVYALVIQTLSTAVISTILLWSISKWKPSFGFSFKELNKLMGFSAYVFFDAISSSFFTKLDVFFIGKVFSPAMLGFYTRAESLNSQVTTFTSTSIKKVFYPILSSLKDNKAVFDNVYFKVVSLVCFVSFIISGLLYTLAEPMIIGLFGEKWMFSVVIFQILIFKSYNVPLNGIMLNALLSSGRAKENFQIGIVRKIIRATPIVVGLIYGLIPFVWAVTLISFVLTLYNIFYLKKYLGISLIYHIRKVFEGILPFLFLVLFLNFFQFKSFGILLVISLCYIVIYLIYANLIKMEGWNFIKSEIQKQISK